MSSDLSDGENVGVGTVAAFVEAMILQPTLYWKNMAAQGMPFTADPRKIYRGTLTSVINEMQMMACQFGLNGFLLRHFNSSDSSSASSASSSSGGMNSDMGVALIAGGISAITTNPVELIMIQQQKFGGSFVHQVGTIGRNFGVMKNGLMRGLTPCIFRDSIYTLGLLGVTPFLMNTFQNRGHNESMSGFYASMVGGCVAALLSHPFDIVKTCMQGDLQKETYTTFAKTIVDLWKEGGITRIYAGCFWRTVNITGTVYIANEVRVRASKVLLERKGKGKD